MTLIRQTDQHFLIFKRQISQNDDKQESRWNSLGNNFWFWTDRLVLNKGKQCDKDYWNFTVCDLLMNESRSIRFRKSGPHFDELYAVPMDGEFGFVVEYSNEIKRINFVRIDWDLGEFQLIQHFERQSLNFTVFLDKMEPSKFCLYCYYGFDTYDYQVCELVKGKIELGEIHKPSVSFDFYSNKKLISRPCSYSADIDFYDIKSKKRQTFGINASLLWGKFSLEINGRCEWVNERLYVSVKFQQKNGCRIAWTDFETKRWNLMDFETNLNIKQLKFSKNGLVVLAQSFGDKFETKIYSIPIRKPNHLRKSAWLLTIKVMKQRGEKDPYAAAKEFLPLNSDLREYWFKDEEPKKSLKRKLDV